MISGVWGYVTNKHFGRNTGKGFLPKYAILRKIALLAGSLSSFIDILLLTTPPNLCIMYLFNKHTIKQRRGVVEIIISSNTSKPIYEQITSQIKAMIMSGELKTGDPIPSMRALAKSIHVSVITVQKAYEDLQRDGFIETTVGRGSFVSAQNKDFYQEEQQRLAEEHLQEAADIGRTSGISLEKLVELLTMFYQEED